MRIQACRFAGSGLLNACKKRHPGRVRSQTVLRRAAVRNGELENPIASYYLSDRLHDNCVQEACLEYRGCCGARKADPDIRPEIVVAES